MARLGTRQVADVPIDQMLSKDEVEDTENESTPSPEKLPEPVTEPVPLPPKKKRQMSEKQLENLKKGRAKKLEMNQKSKELKKKSVTIKEEKTEEPVIPSTPSTPATAAEHEPEPEKKEIKKRKRVLKQRLPTPPRDTPPPSSESEEDMTFEELDSDTEFQKDAYIDKMVDEYLSRKAQKKSLKMSSKNPELKRSSLEDVMFV